MTKKVNFSTRSQLIRGSLRYLNTTSTSSCMSLTFHNKVGLTDNMMHGIDSYLY